MLSDLVHSPQFARINRLKAGKIVTVSLNEAFERMKHFDRSSEMYQAARSVGATFGDSA
jgi:hypothetical protein